MSRRSRLAPVLVLAVTIVAQTGPLAPPAASATTAAVVDTLQAATSSMLDRLGTERSASGIVPLRADSTLASIAQARAADMAARGYFAHTAPDGTDFVDLIEASGIVWLGAGEVIAWNTGPDLAASLDMATTGWMSSPTHRDLLLSGDFNYGGAGAAAAGDRVYWAVVMVKSPDHTPPVATIRAPSVGSSITYGKRYVSVGWRATDPPLAVLTAGVGAYQLQWRRAGGSWQTRSWTTATSQRLPLPIGRKYEFRVRARDRAGNVGSWTRIVAART